MGRSRRPQARANVALGAHFNSATYIMARIKLTVNHLGHGQNADQVAKGMADVAKVRGTDLARLEGADPFHLSDE
jgi:hypothetical protein